MKARQAGIWVAVFAVAVTVRAGEQVWNDGGPSGLWNLSDLNWDVDTAWVNGNSAVFAGGGETVDVSGAVSVANITFQTNGYVVADADNNGTLTVAGLPSVFSVANAAQTGTVSEVLGGSGGLTKAGNGVLNLTTNNAYYGTTTVSAGILRLARGNLMALGQTGGGTNDTVVAAGATLDFNGCYVNSGTAEKFTISGSGVDGKGALVNTLTDMVNKNITEIILQDNATVGGPYRMDFAVVTGNGKTFTKTGNHQLCVRNLTNATVVVNQGLYTLLDDNRALGGSSPGDTIVNGGTLNAWNTMTIPERITFNGGALAQGNPNMQLFTLSGYLTVNSNVNFTSSSITNGVEISGYVDGPGGFTQTSVGWCYFTGNTNSYTGPTTVNGGCPLYVGKTNLYSGVLGSGTVTNGGNLYGYSSRISQGNIVNNGSLYLCTGLLSTAGSVVNNNNLYIERGGSFVVSNAFFGMGVTYLRFNGDMAISGSVSSNGQFRIARGSLTLTNGAVFRCTGEMQVADLLNVNFLPAYPYPTNHVAALINVQEGCALYAQAITFGNATNPVSGGVTGILNQVGGLVQTTGTAAEENGIRLGHYSLAYSVYNMMGGTLIVGKDYDLGCATDGTGWFKQTGGEVFAKRVMLNERWSTGGYGRLTVSGGVMNLGSLTGSTLALSNGITVDPTGPYLVEFGGAGGVIRAVTNISSDLKATLYGTGASAITFDTTNWAITLSGNLTGAGGLNKTGSGVLTLSGTNTYSGATRVMAGTLTPTANYALSTNSVLAFGVSADGSCGRLAVSGDLSLEGFSLGVANPEQLDKARSYTVASWGGSLLSPFGADILPGPWYVYYDWDNKRVQIKAATGTLIQMQ
jgi:autotransporter-associated beta strand protein